MKNQIQRYIEVRLKLFATATETLRNSPDAAARRNAVYTLSRGGDPAMLVSHYAIEKDKEVKMAIVSVLRDARTLETLARDETNRDVKRWIYQRLAELLR